MSFDYPAKAKSRIILQYQNSVKMMELVRQLALMINSEFEQPYDIINNMMSIDDMEGAQLDIIGRILVQDRPVILGSSVGFFGYEGTPNATAYGVAPYFDYENSYPYIPMPDEMYRRLLKGKAIKNSCGATNDDVFQCAEIVTGTEVSRVISANLAFSIEFVETPDTYSQLLIDNYDIIPQPQGIKFTGWSVAP